MGADDVTVLRARDCADHRSALAQVERLLPLSRTSGNRIIEAALLTAQTVALTEQGAEASRPAKQTLQIARDTGDPLSLADATWGAVPALLATGDSATARSLLDELHAATNGQPQRLMTSVAIMYELKYRAIELMKIPTADGKETAGPSFE